MKDIADALIDVRLWWKYIGSRDASHRFELAIAEHPSRASAPDLNRALQVAMPEAIRERRRQLHQSGVSREERGIEEPGRLLIFDYESTMSDGLAESESGGLLDVHNCPPASFWLGFAPRMDERAEALGYKQVLVSWIPLQVVPAVTKGVNVIAEGCLDWVEGRAWKNTRLAEQLLSVLHNPIGYP